MDYMNLLNNSNYKFTTDDIATIISDIILSNKEYNSLQELVTCDSSNVKPYDRDKENDFRYKVLPDLIMKHDSKYGVSLASGSSNIRNAIAEKINVFTTEMGNNYYILKSNVLYPSRQEVVLDNEQTGFRITINSSADMYLDVVGELLSELSSKQIPFDIKVREINDYNNIGYADPIVLTTTAYDFNDTCEIVNKVCEKYKDSIIAPNRFMGANNNDLFATCFVDKMVESNYSAMDLILATIELDIDEYCMNFYQREGKEYDLNPYEANWNKRRWYLGILSKIEKLDKLLTIIINDIDYIDLNNLFASKKKSNIETIQEEVKQEEVKVEEAPDLTTQQTNNEIDLDNYFAELYKNTSSSKKDDEEDEYEESFEPSLPPIEGLSTTDIQEDIITPEIIDEKPVDEEIKEELNNETQKKVVGIRKASKGLMRKFKNLLGAIIGTTILTAGIAGFAPKDVVNDNKPSIEFESKDEQELSSTQLIGGLVEKINALSDSLEDEPVKEVVETTEEVVEDKTAVETKKNKLLFPDDAKEVEDFNFGVYSKTAEIPVTSLNEKERKNLGESIILGEYKDIASYETLVTPVCVSQSGDTMPLIEYLRKQKTLEEIPLDGYLIDIDGDKVLGKTFISDTVIPLMLQNNPDHIYTISDILSDRTMPNEEVKETSKKKGFFSRLFGKNK